MKRTGIFYVLCGSEEQLWENKFRFYYSFKESGITSHKEFWHKLTKGSEKWKDCPWYYMPRGRVRQIDNKDISKRKYEIIISDMLTVPAVIEKIRNVFGLEYDVRIRQDNSGEYDCELFNRE